MQDPLTERETTKLKVPDSLHSISVHSTLFLEIRLLSKQIKLKILFDSVNLGQVTSQLMNFIMSNIQGTLDW